MFTRNMASDYNTSLSRLYIFNMCVSLFSPKQRFKFSLKSLSNLPYSEKGGKDNNRATLYVDHNTLGMD